MSDPRIRMGIGVACFGLPLLLSIAFSLEQRFFLDDAMIYLTYAKNIATGGGWTFNTGANDHAVTSALHTVIQSLLYLGFFDPAEPQAIFPVVKVVEAIVVALGVFFFHRVLVSSGIDPVLAGCAVAAFVSAKFVAVYHLFSGMETPLYLVFLMLACLAWATDRLRAVGLLTGLLYLVRPEAVLVGPVLAALDLGFARRDDLQAWFRVWIVPGAIAAAIVISVGTLFYITKGSMLPDSAEVKLLTANNWGTYVSRIPDVVMGFWYAIPFALLGLFSLERKPTAVNALLACCAVLVLLFIALGLPRAPWYYTPFNVGFFTLSACGLASSTRWLVERALPRWPVYALLAVALIAVDGMGIQQVRANRWAMRWHGNDLDGGLGAASRWLAERVPPETRVAAGSIGYVGYYATSEVVDMVGLLDPEVARQTYAGNPDYWHDVYAPAYVIRKLQYREGVEDLSYRLIGVFGDSRHPDKATGVFARSDVVASRDY